MHSTAQPDLFLGITTNMHYVDKNAPALKVKAYKIQAVDWKSNITAEFIIDKF